MIVSFLNSHWHYHISPHNRARKWTTSIVFGLADFMF